MNVLAVNVGSSTVKLVVVGPSDEVLATREMPASATAGDVQSFALGAPAFDAIGHRIVHGGATFTTATVVDRINVDEVASLDELAPLHNPPAVRMLRAMIEWDANRPNVACFDTTFHRTMSEPARTYAIPESWRVDHGVRRYGFHGLSHAYASRRVTELLGDDPSGRRIVCCHLGSGASIAAIHDGESVDTTMGFTPVEGLVMASRSGDVDPGALAWLLERGAVSADQLADALNHRSGLLALAGTDDMRDVLSRSERGDARAQLARDVYVHRLTKAIAAMTASMAGLDALVFTGGVGARSAEIRRRVCARLDFLGVGIDEAVNAGVDLADADVSASSAATRTLVVHAREELEIARQVDKVLRG